MHDHDACACNLNAPSPIEMTESGSTIFRMSLRSVYAQGSTSDTVRHDKPPGSAFGGSHRVLASGVLSLFLLIFAFGLGGHFWLLLHGSIHFHS